MQNYAFTTKSVTAGHVYIDGRKCQVTDTPGLLNRPAEDRNKIERLTISLLTHVSHCYENLKNINLKNDVQIGVQLKENIDEEAKLKNKECKAKKK